MALAEILILHSKKISDKYVNLDGQKKPKKSETFVDYGHQVKHSTKIKKEYSQQCCFSLQTEIS